MSDRFSIWPSVRTQHRISWLMEVSLVGLFFIGLERGSVGIMVNTAVSFLVAQLPPVLRNEYDVPVDPALALWLTGAAFLHALGTVGIPGTELTSFYANVWWWDHLTHALSASVVAAAGYTTARAIDKHSAEISLPPTFMFVFILMIVLAFGVFWEVLEFLIGIGAEQIGTAKVLTQYGLGDTMLDLVFNSIGAVLVATWGTAYLTDLSDALVDRLMARQER